MVEIHQHLNSQVYNTTNANNPSNYTALVNTTGQALINSYFVTNSDGSGLYPRYLDIAVTGNPDGSNGGSNIRFLTNPIAISSPAVERPRIASNGYVGVGNIIPRSLFNVVKGSAGGMNFYYESGVFESNSDHKVGIYNSLSDPTNSTSGGGASLALGFTNYVNVNGRYPGFEIQNAVYGTDLSQNLLKFNLLERGNDGKVLASNSSILALTGNGNVLINKTNQVNSSYKLDVNGSGRFNSIVVNTSGADFVFRKGYRLNSLKFVENYIAINHHLPEIASASRMTSDGMDVGEMNKKLLQKIEELMLYLIQKDRQLYEQGKKIKKVNERLSALENQVKRK